MELRDILKNELFLHINKMTTVDYDEVFILDVIEDEIDELDWNNGYLAHKGLSMVASIIINKYRL